MIWLVTLRFAWWRMGAFVASALAGIVLLKLTLFQAMTLEGAGVLLLTLFILDSWLNGYRLRDAGE